jgi:predicted KAP-like P-loop ATPase
LEDLFPPATWDSDGRDVTQNVYPKWEANLRVCHDRIFDRYFHLALPGGQLSQAAVERVLGALTDVRALTAELLAVKEQGQLGAMLTRLNAHTSAIHAENALPVLTALFNIGDDLPDGRTNSFDLSPLERAYRLAVWSLTRSPDHDFRMRVFTAAANESTGLYLPVHQLRLDESEERRKEHPETVVFREQDLAVLREDAVSRINAHADSLGAQRHVGRLLHMWGVWSDFSGPREWVRHFIETDEGLMRFVCAFAYTTTTWESGKAPRTEWHMRAENLTPLVDIEEVHERLRKLDITLLSHEDQRAVQAFREMWERHKKGIADEPISPLMR